MASNRTSSTAAAAHGVPVAPTTHHASKAPHAPNAPKVRDIMTGQVFSAAPDLDLLAVRDRMWDVDVRHMPIVDVDGHLVGLISHRDLLRSMGESAVLPSQQARADERSRLPVTAVMTKDVETVPPDFDAKRAALLMSSAKFGCLPVVEGKRLVGILTEADFVRLFAEGMWTPSPRD